MNTVAIVLLSISLILTVICILSLIWWWRTHRSPLTAVTCGVLAKPQYNYSAAGAFASAKGVRTTMEDAHSADLSIPAMSVFDGHRGVRSSHHCAAHVDGFLTHRLSQQSDPSSALAYTYADLEVALAASLKKITDDDGCTGITVYLGPTSVHCANVGDSRALLLRGSRPPVLLSVDHKPAAPSEAKRIIERGGTIGRSMLPLGSGGALVASGPVRAWPSGLSVSRTLGDYKLKITAGGRGDPGIISAVCDVRQCSLDSSAQYIVIACDGLWDVLTPDDVSAVAATAAAAPLPRPPNIKSVAASVARAASNLRSSPANLVTTETGSPLPSEREIELAEVLPCPPLNDTELAADTAVLGSGSGRTLEQRAAAVAKALVNEALRRETLDNVTVGVLAFEFRGDREEECEEIAGLESSELGLVAPRWEGVPAHILARVVKEKTAKKPDLAC